MRPALSGLGALALLALSTSTPAQVTYVHEPPTVEQLQQMLSPKRPSATLRSRGVVWEGGQPPATAAAAPANASDTGAGSGPRPEPATGADAAAGPAVAMPIGFDASSARVSRRSMAYLEVIAQLLAKEPSLRLTIEGHTDASGHPQRNLVLSWDRALSVYRVLVERYGIDGRRLQPLGRGSQDPLEGLAEGSPMNRRVQFRAAG